MPLLSSYVNESLNGEDLDKLRAKNVLTTQALFELNQYDLARENSIKYNALTKAKRAIERRLVPPLASLRTIANSAKEKLQIVSTGIHEFDKMLSGGLHSGDLIELRGPSISGKTTLCLHIIAATLIHNLDVIVLTNDPKFPMKNLEILIREFSPSSNEEEIATLLNHVHITFVSNEYEFFDALDYIDASYSRQEFVRASPLLIIEGLTYILFPKYFQTIRAIQACSGSNLDIGDARQRIRARRAFCHQLISQTSFKLKALAKTQSKAVLVTTQDSGSLGCLWRNRIDVLINISDRSCDPGISPDTRVIRLVKTSRSTPATNFFLTIRFELGRLKGIAKEKGLGKESEEDERQKRMTQLFQREYEFDELVQQISTQVLHEAEEAVDQLEEDAIIFEADRDSVNANSQQEQLDLDNWEVLSQFEIASQRNEEEQLHSSPPSELSLILSQMSMASALSQPLLSSSDDYELDS